MRINPTNLLIGCGGLMLAASATSCKQSTEKPNILLIVTDQQSFNMMSCAGNSYVNTPNMDSIAEQGYMFNNAYCSNPVSMPSRFALITGQFSSIIGQSNNATKVNREEVFEVTRKYSLGNIFRKNGYNTFYSGKTHLYGAKGSLEEYGFDLHGTDPYDGAAEFAETFFADTSYTSEKPFFLYLSFMNPHDICYGAGEDPRFHNGGLSPRSMAATAKYLEQKENMPRKDWLKEVPPAPSNMDTIPEYQGQYTLTGSGFRDWDEEQWMTYRWMYKKLTEEVDAQIGRVLAALKKSGLEDNTIIVFTSDHGDMQQAHGFVFKSKLLEECQKIPFVFKGKGIKKGIKDFSTLVCNGIDLAPTLYELAGIEAPEYLPGISLKPYLTGKGKKPSRSHIVLESSVGLQIHDGKYKYSVLSKMDYAKTLYNISEDPGEQNNLIALPEMQKKIDGMHAELTKESAFRGHEIE